MAFAEGLIRLSRSAVLGGAVLVATNLIPLVGVLWWGWDAFVVVFLYWLENGVVGVVTVLKILKAATATPASGIILAAFFVVHYGLFWAGHGFFVLLLPLLAGFGSGISPFTSLQVSPAVVLVALGALAVSHLGNYVFVFLREREYLRAEPLKLMFQPYPRLVTLHLVILFGAILTIVLGQPVALVALLVLLKIALEVGLFTRDRRTRLASGGPFAPPPVAPPPWVPPSPSGPTPPGR
jgi:hypothetical protein